MRISRSLGVGAVLLSGAIHTGALLWLAPEPKPPEEARGALAVGVSLMAGSGPDGGGEQVAAETTEQVEPATAERMAPQQAEPPPPEEAEATPPDAAEPPPDVQVAEAPPPDEPPPPEVEAVMEPPPDAAAPEALRDAPEPDTVEIASTVEPEVVVAEAPMPLPPIPTARPTPPPRPQVRRPPPREVVKRAPPPKPEPKAEPRRERMPPAWTAAPPAAAQGPSSENPASAAASSIAAPAATRGAAGSERGQEGTPAPVGLGGTSTDYAARLRAWLERHKEYPRRARLRRQEGTATLRFAIDDRGRVLWRRIQESSGYSILDEAVEEAIDRAQPLPTPPPHTQREFIIPVVFNLR